jgi:agmatine/peptidylarginine deiminase
MISIPAISQPIPPVRMCAEWEPARGTLIRWPLGIPYSLVGELAEDDSLYVLVETQYEEDQAISNFISHGVNIDHCKFIYTNTYSHWTRDWGPVSIFDGNGIWGIVDPIFDGYPWVPGGRNEDEENNLNERDWSEDDAVNADVAAYFNCELYPLPAYLTGGNLMVDGHGTAFSTQQMINENLDIMSEEDFFNIVNLYTGIDNYNIMSNTEDYGIQHMDCAAKLLDEETVIIKQLPTWHPEYWRIENLAEEFATLENCYGRPYNIFRVFCDSYEGNSVAAYTNSLILNKKVFIPLFDIEADDTALQVFEDAMPGYEIHGIYYLYWYYYDALHCRTRAIYDKYMLRIWHRRLDDCVIEADEFDINVMIDDRSEAGLIEDELKVYWREHGEIDWNTSQLYEITGIDSFSAEIHWHRPGTVIEYYISASDLSGRAETLPRTAPDGYYSFIVISSSESDEYQVPQPGITVLYNYPNPFNPSTTISFNLTTSLRQGSAGQAENTENIELVIYNLKGQKVKTLDVATRPSTPLRMTQARGNTYTVTWDGTDYNNKPVSSGVYLYQLKVRDKSLQTRKMLILK